MTGPRERRAPPTGARPAVERPAAAAPAATARAAVAAPAPGPGVRTGRLRALAQRLAMWGAGPGGTHRAWGPGAPVHPARVPAAVRTDGPVVLRELPST